MNYRSIGGLFALFLLGCSGVENKDRASDQLIRWAEDLKVPAVAAFVSEGNTTRYYTWGTDAQGLPTSRSTLFEAASLSKPLFAASVQNRVSSLDSTILFPEKAEAYTLVRTATKEDPTILMGEEATIFQVLTHTIGDTFQYRETAYLALQVLGVAPVISGKKDASWGHLWFELDTKSYANGYITTGIPERGIRKPQQAFCNGTLTTSIKGLNNAYRQTVEPELTTWLSRTAPVESNLHWAPGIGVEVAGDTFAWHYGSNYCYNSFWIKNQNTGRTAGILTNSVSGRRMIARWIPFIMEKELNSLPWIGWYP